MKVPINPALDTIESRILLLRGQKVMLDADLAELYGVKTKRFNEQVRRNRERFPADFMFRLTDQEVANLRSQIATSSLGRGRSGWGGKRYLPFAFTEHRQGDSRTRHAARTETQATDRLRLRRLTNSHHPGASRHPARPAALHRVGRSPARMCAGTFFPGPNPCMASGVRGLGRTQVRPSNTPLTPAHPRAGGEAAGGELFLRATPIPTIPSQSAASDWSLDGSEACSSKPRLAPHQGGRRYG